MSRYDAIIVGARPAGAGTAAFMAQAGMRVLLTDRVTFPKTTLSCPLYFANTMDLLNRIGVMDRVDAIGAPKLRWYQLEFGDIHLRGQMLPYGGYDYTYHIRREIFDDVFLQHVAAMPNIDTRLGFNVTGLVREKERVVGVRGSAHGGPEEEIRAPAVIGADGVFSTIAEQTGSAKYNVRPAHTCVYYAYYENMPLAGSDPTATIYFDPVEHFAMITANGESNLTVVSLSLPASRFEWARANHETLHTTFANKLPKMAARMEPAKRVSPVYGVSPRESFYRTPYGPGWVLVGDAAYYKDPLPGQGIHDALRSAEMVACAMSEYRSNGSTNAAWNAAFQKYQTKRDRETHAMYELTEYISNLERERGESEKNVFRAIAAMPDWSNRYVSLYNGATDVEWFRRFDTPFRILLDWRWRKFKQRFASPSQASSTDANTQTSA